MRVGAGGHRVAQGRLIVARESSGIEIRAAWRALDEAAVAEIPVTLGVYEIADEDGNIVELGYAGGRSAFGLRGEILQKAADFDEPLVYRVEVTHAYMSRHKELTDFQGVRER